MQSLAKVGAVPVGGTPESFGQLIIDETARWAVVIKRQNLKAE